MTTDERVDLLEKQQDELRERWLDFLETTHRTRADYERKMNAQIQAVTELLSAVQTGLNGINKTQDKLQSVLEAQDTMIQSVREESKHAIWILKNGGRQGVLQRQDRLEKWLEEHPETCPIGKAFYAHMEEHRQGKLTKPQKVAVIVAAATALPGWTYGVIAFIKWLGHRLAEAASQIVPP